jgi:hypothetical protein
MDEKSTSSPVKVIVVKDFSYLTYLSVLLWVQSHHISFAPLVSTFRTDGATRLEAVPLRAVALSSSTSISPTSPSSSRLPLPVSPKSVFRLAQYLSLPTLVSIALDNLRSQLTPANAAYELYSDVSPLFPEQREVVMRFVVERWSEVKGEKGMREMEEKAEQEELDGRLLGTAMLLARRLGEGRQAEQ